MYARTLCMFVGLLAFAGGCARHPRGMDILEGVGSHELVVRAKVLEVGPSCMSTRIGEIMEANLVKYDVIDVYKGAIPSGHKRVWVNHIIGFFAHPKPAVPIASLIPGTEVVLFCEIGTEARLIESPADAAPPVVPNKDHSVAVTPKDPRWVQDEDDGIAYKVIDVQTYIPGNVLFVRNGDVVLP